MKNTTETNDRTITKVERHFGGKHITLHFSDGTTCNVYEDGYKSNSERVVKTFSPSDNTMNKTTTKTTAKSKATSKANTAKKTVKKAAPATDVAPTPVEPKVEATAAITTDGKKLSRADVKAAVENFLKNPPDKHLTLEEVYQTIGFAHRQVYMMVREHGVSVGKADRTGKGRKETLYTFKKAE